ncbi:hypothetical protein ACFW1A_28035 [Kitasatospora sp. NPDC058965]|uniref:hypothetical protein n=1 Tax=Kitasatospora sp. NPDC058965 TaxID=3346682 RepID=UPI00368F1F25
MSLVRELPTRLVGVALVVAACDPMARADPRPVDLVVPALAAGFAWWAAPPVPGRPAAATSRVHLQLARHRNTVLAVVAVALAALLQPGVLLAVALTVLLLGYLLLVDARSHARVPLGPGPTAAACAASLLVLLAALAPAQSSPGARLFAALGIAVAALSVGATLYERRE